MLGCGRQLFTPCPAYALAAFTWHFLMVDQARRGDLDVGRKAVFAAELRGYLALGRDADITFRWSGLSAPSAFIGT